MSNSYLPSNNKPPTAIMLADDDDPFAEVANEGGGQFGKILKYNKGEWTHAAKVVALGTEFLVLMPEALRGDVKFQDGKPVEQRLGLIRDRAKFAKRADLGDTDQALWETDKNGKPIDPWSPQTYVPMIQVETGELYCFIFRSFGGKQTFRDLCRAYSPYRTSNMLPVISIQTDRYKHEDFGWIDIPILRIERWEDSSGVAPNTPAPDRDGGDSAKVIGDSKVVDGEMNDGIPPF
jgi:hypothetical protein